MRLLQSFKMAWYAVSTNKLRTFLTMLGIMIGVVALVVLVSIADGATTSVTDEISGMGSSYLTVTISDDKENPLKLSEISGFAEPDEVDAAAPMARTSVTAKSGYTSESMTLIGTTGSYLDIQQMEIQYGRFIKNADVENNTNVVVLTYDTAVELLGRADVEGEKISLNVKSFLVIGVLTEDSSSSLTKGTNMMSSSSDDEDSGSSVVLEGYIPFSTMTRLADNILNVTQFCASATSEETLDEAENALTELLMERFEYDEDAFSISDHGYDGKCQKHDGTDDRWHRSNLPSGRRHRDHEHYAGLRDRAYQGDRNPKSDRGLQENDHDAVSSGSTDRQYHGLLRRNRTFVGDPEACGDFYPVHAVYDGYACGMGLRSIYRSDRYHLRPVPGQQSSQKKADRRTSLFRLNSDKNRVERKLLTLAENTLIIMISADRSITTKSSKALSRKNT